MGVALGTRFIAVDSVGRCDASSTLRGLRSSGLTAMRSALSGRAIFDGGPPALNTRVVSTSGPLPVPDWIRFTVLQDSGNPEKEIQVLYCPERNLEGAASEPVMFQVVVELPMGLFDALWKIVSGTPIARVKVGTSFTAKDDVSGHFPILEITDLEKGCASTTGHQFWFDVSS